MSVEERRPPDWHRLIFRKRFCASQVVREGGGALRGDSGAGAVSLCHVWIPLKGQIQDNLAPFRGKIQHLGPDCRSRAQGLSGTVCWCRLQCWAWAGVHKSYRCCHRRPRRRKYCWASDASATKVCADASSDPRTLAARRICFGQTSCSTHGLHSGVPA